MIPSPPHPSISLLLAKDEVETPSGQELSMAAPGRTISTLHLLSILQNLEQDFAKPHNSHFLEILLLLLLDTSPFSTISSFPALCPPHFSLFPAELPPDQEGGSSTTATCGVNGAGWDLPYHRMLFTCASLCRAGT